MTSNKRQIEVKADFYTRLTRLDEHHYWTKPTDKEEKIKSPRLAFLKISDNALFANLQSNTNQHETQASQKSQISLN